MLILFQTIDRSRIEKTAHPGGEGFPYWQTREVSGLRLRIIEFSGGYVSDHWCRKGHIVHCLEGAFDSGLLDGTMIRLSEGMYYIVSDNVSAHRSTSATGGRLLILDGDFLK